MMSGFCRCTTYVITHAGQHTSNITMTWTTLFLLQDKRKGGNWLDQVKGIASSLREVISIVGYSDDLLLGCLKCSRLHLGACDG